MITSLWRLRSVSVGALTVATLMLLSLLWSKQYIAVQQWHVACKLSEHSGGIQASFVDASAGWHDPDDSSGQICYWVAETRWLRPEALLACIDLPPTFNAQHAVVRGWLVGPGWVQSSAVVTLPETTAICLTAPGPERASSAWIAGLATGASGRNSHLALDGASQGVFLLEYQNASLALLDPEPAVALRKPINVKTPIAFVGSLIHTTMRLQTGLQAAARALVGTAASKMANCDGFAQAHRQFAGNCSAAVGSELATCVGANGKQAASPLEMLRRPVAEWSLRQFTWGETAEIVNTKSAWAHKTMVLLGDSMMRKLASVWTTALQQDPVVIPCSCATRPWIEPFPSNVSHIPVKGLADTLEGAIQQLQSASANAAPGDVLVVNAGLWDAAYGTLAGYGQRVSDLLIAAAESKFERVMWLTTTAIHPGRRKANENEMNSIVTWHNYFTTVRIDAVNKLALSQLYHLEQQGRIKAGRLEVVDATHVTQAAPWSTMPGDMVHYCPTVLLELQYLLHRQLVLRRPGDDDRHLLR